MPEPEKKGRLGSFLKGLVLVEVPDPAAKPSEAPVASAPAPVSGPTYVPTGTYTPQGVALGALPDASLNQALCDGIEKRVLADPGAEAYKRFMVLLKALEGAILDEATRCRAAFSVAMGQGLTQDQILASLEKMRAALTNERVAFDRSVDARLANTVKGMDANTASTHQKLQAAQDRLVSLQQEIVKSGQEIASLAHDKETLLAAVAAERGKADNQKGEFARAHGALEQKLAARAQQLVLYK